MPLFLKGQSGNYAGRPKGAAGLAKYIRGSTNDGKEMVDLHCAIMRGEKLTTTFVSEDGQEEEKAEMLPSIQDRQKSAEWLANRAFGMAPQVAPEDDELLPKITDTMTDEELLSAAASTQDVQ